MQWHSCTELPPHTHFFPLQQYSTPAHSSRCLGLLQNPGLVGIPQGIKQGVGEEEGTCLRSMADWEWEKPQALMPCSNQELWWVVACGARLSSSEQISASCLLPQVSLTSSGPPAGRLGWGHCVGGSPQLQCLLSESEEGLGGPSKEQALEEDPFTAITVPSWAQYPMQLIDSAPGWGGQEISWGFPNPRLAGFLFLCPEATLTWRCWWAWEERTCPKQG